MGFKLKIKKLFSPFALSWGVWAGAAPMAPSSRRSGSWSSANRGSAPWRTGPGREEGETFSYKTRATGSSHLSAFQTHSFQPHLTHYDVSISLQLKRGKSQFNHWLHSRDILATLPLLQKWNQCLILIEQTTISSSSSSKTSPSWFYIRLSPKKSALTPEVQWYSGTGFLQTLPNHRDVS